MRRSLIPWTGRMTWPVGEAENRFARLLEPLLGPEEEWWPMAERFAPRTNVAETEDEIEVTAELPGLKAEEFDVEVHDGELWITGEKKEEKEEKGKTYHRIERRHGEFRRVIGLPKAVDTEKVKAEYHDGVLKVTIPKTEEVKPKHIKVKSE